MDGLLRPSGEQLERIQPFFPKSRGDNRKVLSGIIHVLRSGLRSRGCPSRLWTLQDHGDGSGEHGCHGPPHECLGGHLPGSGGRRALSR